MNSQTSTKQTKARMNKKTAESTENIISAMKRNKNHNTMTFPPFRKSRFGCPRISRALHTVAAPAARAAVKT